MCRVRLAYVWASALAAATAVRASHAACDAWHIAWHTPKWREEFYVPNELLKNFTLASEIDHYVAAPRRNRPAQGAADGLKPPWPTASELDDVAALDLLDCSIAVTRLRQSPGCERSMALAREYQRRGLRSVVFVVLGEENSRSCAECAAFYEVRPATWEEGGGRRRRLSHSRSERADEAAVAARVAAVPEKRTVPWNSLALLHFPTWLEY